MRYLRVAITRCIRPLHPWFLACLTLAVVPALPATSRTSGADRLEARSHVATGGAIVVDGVLAETKADGPCYPDSGLEQFVDCGNGTVFDTTQNLLWLERATCLRVELQNGTVLDDGLRTWYEANQWAATLAEGTCSLSDHSQPGDWRLPTVEELTALENTLNDCSGGAPIYGQTGGCYDLEPWATGLRTGFGDRYWSSEGVGGATTLAFYLEPGSADVNVEDKDERLFVWAVRPVQ